MSATTTPQRTEAGRRSGVEAALLLRRYDPRLRVHLAVQREFNLSSGIVRGARDDQGRLIPDHVLVDGVRWFGEQMRRGTRSVWEHQVHEVRALAAAGTRVRVAAAVGNGNLTQNPGFVAWTGQDGRLVRVRDEPVDSRVYDTVVLEDGAVRVCRVRFQGDDARGWRAFDVDDGGRALGAAAVAFSGQRLVAQRRALSAAERREQILDGQFYDLRHVFRFAAVRSAGQWKDVGLERFYDGGALERAVLADALAGAPVRTPWRDLGVDRGALEAALIEKNYVPGDAVERGTFRVDDQALAVSLLEGIYPHNVFGVDHQGRPLTMVVTGWSNNVGYTLEQLATVAQAFFSEAVLLDNGGDVFFLGSEDRQSAVIAPPLAWAGTKLTPESRGGITAVGFAEGRFTLRSMLLFCEDLSRPPLERPFEVVPLRDDPHRPSPDSSV